MSFGELLYGTQLIEILQNLFSPQFDWIFVAITSLGDGTVLVGLGAAIYWCFDKSRGRLVTYILLSGAYLNLFLKILVPWPRPPVNLRIVEKNEPLYGFPSGHAQDSATFWTWITLNFRRRILGILGTAIVLGVGVSRIYLGLHYPAQVIGGWAIGLVVACFGMLVLRYIQLRKVRVGAVPQILLAFFTLIPMVVAVALAGVGEVYPGEIGGYLFGFSVGVLAEDRYLRFTVDVSTARKVIRLVIGGTMTGCLVLAFGLILPDIQLIPAFVNSVIRGLFVAAIVPAVFTLVERHRT